jgi:alpha-L-fucosidase
VTYQPSWESVRQHPLPTWFDEAKLGIFIHWGLYSVPGWAPQVPDIQKLLEEHGPSYMLAHNPYAEWYLNSMRIEGSPTWRHHLETYGPGFDYDDFIEIFDKGARSADLDSLASLCKSTGAGYVVLTTKHHDGFCLWPASESHPEKGSYHSARDLVGDFTEAVDRQGMRMGLYYSGGYDWSYNGAVIKSAADTVLAVPTSESYAAYATAHVTELIDRYRPAVLWNDICWPPAGDLPSLFAHYYNSVPDGVVNDRWLQRKGITWAISRQAARAAGWAIERLWRLLPKSAKSLTFPSANHFDFRTPEYTTFDEIQEKKWEATRGVGHSFGANRNERPEDYVTAGELVRLLVDVVAKNGNLLIGIGPTPEGTIPAEQRSPLEGLGEWMRVNSEAIVGTSPWERAEAKTSDGIEVRFTRGRKAVYACLLGTPDAPTVRIGDVGAGTLENVSVLGSNDPVAWSTDDQGLEVTLPHQLPISPVHVLRLSPSEGLVLR